MTAFVILNLFFPRIVFFVVKIAIKSFENEAKNKSKWRNKRYLGKSPKPYFGLFPKLKIEMLP